MPNSPQWSFTPIASFAEISAEWDAINRASSGLPILDARFFALLMKHFGVHAKAMAVVLRDRERALCAGILEPGRLGTWQTYQPSQAPLGAWVHADGFDAAASLPSFFRAGAGRFSLALGLSQLDPEFLPRPASEPRVSTLDYIETATLHVAGSFDDYWANRGKNLRQNHKKQRNRFEKAGVVTELKTHTDVQAVGEAVDEYGRLESRGWKAGEGTALHPGNAQGRFYRELLQEYAASGEAAVYQYLYDGKVVASDLCLSRNGALIILKTTYDEAHSATSPAMLMHYEVLQPIFDERRFTRIEFYGRVLEWHGRLTEAKRVLYHLNYFRLPWLSKLANARGAGPRRTTVVEQATRDEGTRAL